MWWDEHISLNKVRVKEILFEMDISVSKLVLAWSQFIERFQVDLPQHLQSFHERCYGRSQIYAFQILDELATTRYKVRIKFALKRPKPPDNETQTLYKNKINCTGARMAKTEQD